VALDGEFNVFEVDDGFRAVAGKEVESELGVEGVVGLGSEAEEGGGLLLEFVEAALAELAGGFEDGGGGMTDG
jgi:hypothetical protein